MNKVKQEFIKMVENYKQDNGKEPTFVSCGVVWDNGADNTIDNEVIKLNTEIIEDEDDEIFFYCEDNEEFLELCEGNNGQDFIVEEIYDLFDEL